MISDTFTIALAIFFGIYVASTLAYFMFRRYMRFKEEELKKEHARLDDFRAHLERQLMDLNSRFSSSQERWRELNHLVIAGQGSVHGVLNLDTPPRDSMFLQSHGIEQKDQKIVRNQIFVLTPFHDDVRDEFDAIVSVCQSLNLHAIRGDEKVSGGDIFPQLLRGLVQSRAVIANISGRNPNVFYELGIAHALDKAVVLLANRKTEVPFDIQSKLIVFYDDVGELKDRLASALSRTLISRDG